MEVKSSPKQEAHVFPFDLDDAVLINWKIALGMVFLHSREVIHGDFKSANVLFQERLGQIDVKISGFGLSRYLSRSETNNTCVGVGTGICRAPEILPTATATTFIKPNLQAVDVYAYAVLTCNEVVSGRGPFSELRRTDYDREIDGYRPKLPPALDHDLKALIKQCRSGEHEGRPNFTVICEELRRIHYALSKLSS